VAGTLLGCVLAVLGFSRIWLWQLTGLKDYGEHHSLIASTVGFSLVGVILFGSLAGAMLPFLLRSLKFDPAVASAPLVATLVDVTGLVIYFTIASLVLRTTILAPSTPGLVIMEHEKSADSFARFLGLREGESDLGLWTVERIEWHQEKGDDRIVITLVEGESIGRATACGTNNVRMEVAGHAGLRRWTVPLPLMGHPVEVVCDLPLLRRKDDGQPCELSRPLPWEGHLGAVLTK